MKACTLCKAIQPLENFPTRVRGGKPTPYSWCYPCARAKNAAHRAANLDKIRARDRDRQKRKPKAVLAKTAQEWHKRNPEYRREYREKNRETLREYHLDRYQKIPEYYKDNANKRRAAKLQAMPAWASEGKIRDFYFAAEFLGMVTGEWYHVDHIVPLQGKTVCGLHWEGNMQVLTAPENLRKGNHSWPDMP